jgi:creatinine amidohydrolase
VKREDFLDGIFKDTMANLNWTQIARLAEQDALVLLPLGVIEEHGPQLCLGTDIYTAHVHCLYIKEKLEAHGQKVVIAPPFYWGVCQSTGSFIGSFKIRKDTARALLLDILASLADFGFKYIFGVNAHGDIEHQVTILEAFKQASEQLPVNACFVFPQHLIPHYGLSENEPYICPLQTQTIRVSSSQVPDVHAGDIETATMLHFYPLLTDGEKAKTLPAVALEDDKIWGWLLGGHTQELSVNGYLGAPADFEGVAVMDNIHDIAERFSGAILARITRS